MYIQEVTKNVVHESLECGRGIGQPERHDKPFKGAVMGPKGGFPFVTFCNADQIISVPEVNCGVKAGFARRGQEVGNERKWISVLFGDPI